MFTAQQYQSELNINNTWLKYTSPENLERIVSFLVEKQWLPSQVTVERALEHLKLARTDGRTERDDARAARAEAQRRYDAAAAEADRLPLTRQELDEFASLSKSDLARLYWGADGEASDYFSIRYRAASRQHGFVIPPKPREAS
jgi:hypothetical protein